MTGTFKNWADYVDTEKTEFLKWEGERTHQSLKWITPGSSIVLAGHTNHGKTSLLMSMIVGLLRNNPDLMVIDFSIDDPANKRFSQYTAIMADLPINSCSNYKVALVTPEEKTRYANARAEITDWDSSTRLLVYEAMRYDADNMIDQNTIGFMAEKVRNARKMFPGRKILFIVDAINDVDPDTGTKNFDVLDREQSVVKTLQKLAIGTKSVMMATTHLRKNQLRRPNLEDLKGNSYIAYRATVAIGIYNDAKAVGLKNSKVTWEEISATGVIVSRPILEAWFLKSKVDDCTFEVIAFQQQPHKGRATEFPETNSVMGAEGHPQDEAVNLIYGEVS